MKFFNHFRCNIPKKFQHKIENLESDTFYKKFDNVVLSCYFNGKRDPIHHDELKNEKQEKDNYNYIKPLYETCLKQKLHLIIFHDNLSENFLKKYTTDKIIFRRTQLVSELSINDERFIIYYEYLHKNPYKNVLSSDVSDVYINKNPFYLVENYDKREPIDLTSLGNLDENLKKKIKSSKINLDYTSTYFTEKEMKFILNGMLPIPENQISKHKVFLGTNSINNKSFEKIPPWFERRMKKIKSFNYALKKHGKNFSPFVPEDFQIYNPGTIMAKYHDYMCFIRMMLEVLFILAKFSEKANWNMVIASYLVRNYLFENINPETACTKFVYTGFPFNSLYKRQEIPGKSPSCLIHK